MYINRRKLSPYFLRKRTLNYLKCSLLGEKTLLWPQRGGDSKPEEMKLRFPMLCSFPCYFEEIVTEDLNSNLRK